MNDDYRHKSVLLAKGGPAGELSITQSASLRVINSFTISERYSTIWIDIPIKYIVFKAGTSHYY